MRVVRFDRRDARGIDAAHLTGSNAKRLSVATEHDSVRFNKFGDTPCKYQIDSLLR